MRIKTLISYLILLAVVFSCGREVALPDPAVEEPSFHTIHYSAVVNGATTTKATVDGQNHYIFEEGDRLYVSGTGENADKLYGFLHLITGVDATTAHFEGDLYCSDELELESSTGVSVTLVSSHDQVHTVSGGKVTGTTYSDDQFAADFAEAVSKFSHFTSSGTFGSRSFTLAQQSSFLIFNVRMKAVEEAPAARVITAKLYSDVESEQTLLRTAAITVSEAGSVPFVFAFEGETVSLQNAELHLEWNDGEAQSKIIDNINNQALAANNYYTISRSTVPFGGFRIRATENNTDITFNYTGSGIRYSLDGGATWTPYNSVTAIRLNNNQEICFEGARTDYSNTNRTPLFTATAKCYIAGNIMSLLSYSDVLPVNAFYRAFSKTDGNKDHTGNDYRVTWIDINPEDPLILPVTTMSENCYKEMFRLCTSLTHAPDLPATTMATGCYNSMFRNCSSLTYLRCYFSCYNGGGYAKANYNRTNMESWLDKWTDGISTTGNLYCHPDMVTYWTNSKNQSGGWYSNYTIASMPKNWTATEWTPAP